MSGINEVRERFEAWAEGSYHLQRMGDKYRSAITTDAWRAWQAAVAASQGGPAMTGPVMRPRPAQAIDLEQLREGFCLVLQDEFDLEAADPEDHRHNDGRDEALRVSGRLLALIDGQAAIAAPVVTDEAVQRLVRAMENTPGDELIEPNTRLCRRLLAAALQPAKSEED